MGVLAGFLGTMLIGSYMALNGTIEVGSYSVLVFLTQRFLWPFTTLSTLIDDFERTMASTKRIFNMMEVDRKIKDSDSPILLKDCKADILFHNVGFSYDGQKPLLEDFNLFIPFGSSIGIVGDTGSGKTTIAKLLLRLYDIDSGRISIGETSLNDLEISFLRERIGIVNQSPFCLMQQLKRTSVTD